MVYLDNAATTYPKPQTVVDELYKCVSEYCGNPGRGSHALSRRASEAIYGARERIAEYFGTDYPERVVFTYNATYAINLAMKTIIREPCHVITSDIEHNAVIRPLERLSRTLGIRYSCFNTDLDTESAVLSHISKDTRAIVSTLESNVTGKRIPLRVLSDIAKRYRLLLILDASQIAGHEKISLEGIHFDALCAPGHKGLFGIQGSGFVIFSQKERYESFIEGGSGSESENVNMPLLLPEAYEAGTLATPAISTLSRGIDFISAVGEDDISNRISSLSDMLCERIMDVDGAFIYSAENGIVSFNLGNFPSEMVSTALDKCGICTRGGLHCAPSVHKKLGTIKQGTVRASLSYFNTKRDIDIFYNALKNIRKTL